MTRLPGVGPARAAALARLGVERLWDLAFLAPRGVERQGPRRTVAEAREAVGEECSVVVRIGSVRWFRSGRARSVFAADVRDETGSMRALFFNQAWLRGRLLAWAENGEEVELYGRVVSTKSGPALQSPRVGTDQSPLPAPGTLRAIYPTTEGIGQELLRKLVAAARADCAGRVQDPVPSERLAALGLPSLEDALATLDAPKDEDAFLSAVRRFAFEDLLVAQARLAEARSATEAAPAPRHALDARGFEALLTKLPHEPTAGQRAALDDVAADLASGRAMRRLLQGDVGSGKTLVCAAALALAVSGSEGQAALLVPTELLAAQHARTLGPWLGGLGHRWVSLSGSLPAEERARAEAELASGRARIAIGTHALLSDSVRFRRLDLLVIDEQQRFGVRQKELLLARREGTHLLLATATPIPRTLALALFGDLEVSRIEGLPPGRGKRRTRLVPPAKRRAMLAFLDERLAAGEKVYWVTPRIGGAEGDGGGRTAAEAARERLARGRLGRHGVALVHGRLSPEQRDAALARFRDGEARLLVGTSIVEVGLDVCEATVMVVEGAEHFGLAQLHQLRGRVGRGARDAWCFLLAAESAQARLAVLAESEDGFRIAEADLARRGMGDLAGLRQAGSGGEGVWDPDLDLVRAARDLVRDPELRARLLARSGAARPALV